MRFIDEVKITIGSGNGGHGCVSFRREKYIEFGGPDGGDGGNGGDLYFQATKALNTLVKFRGRKNYSAKNGESGAGRQRHGAYGEDFIVPVPIGTIVRHTETGEIIADLAENGQKVLMASGGRGGLGNINFKTSTNQAPRKATYGQEGLSMEVDLELKLLADIALLGLPNAGKSTLIASISAARPKIADYAFTTLEPNLGVVNMGDETSFVVADIPGLIENASEGKGLGVRFLKHIERTKSFVHLVDISWCLEEFEALDSYVTIRDELSKYNKKLLDRKEIICLTKIDAMEKEEVERYVQFFELHLNKKVLPISSVSGLNIGQLKSIMFEATQV